MKDASTGRGKPIVPAKLTRPDTRGLLFRDRLFNGIRDGQGRKVIWISGPAGSGKTMLAASFMESRKVPCIWYQLDEGDADLATFFYYLGLAARSAAPRNRNPLPLLTPEYLQGVHVFAKRFFEQLASRLIGKTRPRSAVENGNPAIVFDNYQDVPEDAVFHTVIHAGLEALPKGMNVFVLSRSDPPPAYARLRASGEMSLIGWEDIRLTASESNAIATIRAGKELAVETLQQLHQTADGWAAGLVLLMESLRIKDLDFQLPRGLPREEIFAYFATEIFDRAAPNVQAFLLETSFLPDMNIRMAQELTGNARAGSIFSSLKRKNYFTSQYARNENAFQYHPLFREFLRAKADATLSPERIQNIRARAAQVLEKNGRGEEAVKLLCEAEKWGEAARLLLVQSPAMISQGRWQMLQGWIASFPVAVVEHQPWLLYWKGVCRFPTSPEGSMEYFARAFAQFRRGKDAAGSFLALAGMLDSVNYRFDTFFELDRLIALMDELRAEWPRFPSPEIEAHVVNSMLNSLTQRQPFNPAWSHWEERAFVVLRYIADADLALHILCGLAFYRLFTGEIEKAKPILDSIEQRVEAGQASTLAVLSVRDLQAFYCWLCADFEKNQWAVGDGLALARHSGIRFLEPYLLGHGAAGVLSTGDLAKADDYLDRMASAMGAMPSKYAEYFYHNLKAWRDLLDGHLVRASTHAERSLERSVAIGGPMMILSPLLIRAMIMHQIKDDAAARAHLSEIRKIVGTMPLSRAEFMAFLIEAQMAFDQGDEAGGRDFLGRAMSIGRNHGYVNGLFWVSETMARLCGKALEAGIEIDYVQYLIRRRGLVPDESLHHLESWPWPLKIYTLGSFEMVRDGEVVQFAGKVQRKPLLLLKALIAFGGRDVSEEVLCDALWPDADGDLAHRSLEVTLYRLRQLIQRSNAVQLLEGKLSLNMEYCWVDAFSLERILNEAAGLWESFRRCRQDPDRSQDAAERAIQLTQRAIGMYRGHFLEVEGGQGWLLSTQERLRAKYIRAVEALADYREASGEREMAVKCYLEALEIDDLNEELYQRLMMIYTQLGQRSRVLSIYSRCRSVLESRLGMKPSPKTQAILSTARFDGAIQPTSAFSSACKKK